MALPAVAASVIRSCVPAAVVLIGSVTPLVAVAPAWSSPTTAPSAGSAAEALTDARTVYGDAVRAVELIGAQRERLAASAQQATVTAERLRADVQAEDGGAIRSVVGRFFSGAPSAADRAIESADNAAHISRLAAASRHALDKAILRAESTRRAYDKVLAEQARRQAGWSAGDVAEFSRSLAQPDERYLVTDRRQNARNEAALRRWERYLDRVIDADLVPPPAARLTDPARLPHGLEALRGPTGEAISGVAEIEDEDGTSLVVLPAETVRAVSTAFGRLGLTTVPGAGTPSTFACGGLVADAWGATDQIAADSVTQWRTLAKVPPSAMQVGDVVLLGDRRDGLEESGIYVGGRQVIVADPVIGTASVQSVSRTRLYGVRRVGVPVPHPHDAPPAGLCGLPAEAVQAAPNGDTGTFAFRPPLAAGSYRISARFGQRGSLWSSTHSGQDFAAPIGAPVTAVADGVVAVDRPSWAGNLVRIDHGGGVETWYAHLSTIDVVPGQQIGKGERIGAVGNEGNSSGPHLHLEVRLDGRAVDAALVLPIPELPRTAHPDGELPDTALCSAAVGSTHLLACDAAVSFRLMSAAFTAELGTTLCITDSYRSHVGRTALTPSKRKPSTAVGTSVHGAGRAVDLCGGVERLDTPEHRWLVKHGASFGWVSPTWAAAGGARPEPWHFESF
jgi:cell wall-associated NlpC family hydrolase